MVFSRDIDGRNEQVEWIRHADTVLIVNDGQERVIGPNKLKQAWADLESLGFVEVYPTDQRKMIVYRDRVLGLVQIAFQGVTLGDGICLLQGQGLDDYADDSSLRAQDEKNDWSVIPVGDLDQCYSSLSFFDADGMRFHLPAYLVADLKASLQRVAILFHLTYEYGARACFSTLSPCQRQAVREFLLMRLSDPHYAFDHPGIEIALSSYWIAQAES